MISIILWHHSSCHLFRPFCSYFLFFGGPWWSSVVFPNPFYPYVVTSPKDNFRLLSVASFPFFLPERAFSP